MTDFLQEAEKNYQASVKIEAEKMALKDAAKAVVKSWSQGDDADQIAEHIEVLECVLMREEPDIDEYVAALRALSDKTLKKVALQEESDLSLRAMYMRDASDYLRIAEIMRREAFVDAAKKAARLDTAARDEIPRPIWDFLMKYYKG